MFYSRGTPFCSSKRAVVQWYRTAVRMLYTTSSIQQKYSSCAQQQQYAAAVVFRSKSNAHKNLSLGRSRSTNRAPLCLEDSPGAAISVTFDSSILQ